MQALQEPETMATDNKKNIRILLVDDSMAMRKIQRTQLEMLGITNLVEAHDGAEGLIELEKNRSIDMVILEWNMRSMDSLAFLKAVRAKPDYARLKIVLCISEADKHKAVEALMAGADNYIIKPFTPEGLSRKLGLENFG
jgi:two-component system, chemotaxis family, chemotaxis protein CheY